MDGKGLAERLRAEIAEEVRQLGDVGLATVLVGDDPASDIYVRRKHDAAQEVGIRSIDHRLPSDTPQEELERLVGELNADAASTASSSRPAGPPRREARSAIDPRRTSAASRAPHLTPGDRWFVPAARSIMRLLGSTTCAQGARAVVVGSRSSASRCRCSSRSERR
jgi:methylenetetrahydrofolate dehydrogenase (NADP+)/methenyltetrahydrofolate cyclohydrolase